LNGRAARLAVLAVGVLALAFLPVCPARFLAHAPCPGCGLVRATMRAASGDLAGAMHLHPLWLAAVAAVGWYAIPSKEPRRTWPAIAVSVAFVAVWLARFFGAFGGPAPV
jgi:Protein of unknown function (DUF2752)